MAANGVSHHIVEDDLAGVEAMLKWLAFVPPTLPGTLPVLRSTDPIGREIEYEPDKGQWQTCMRCVRTN
jgi:acetyl-CoA carboxylase/biotin carboxylase 1